MKDLAAASPDPVVRQELLDLLLAARHDLVSILGRGPEPGADPVKALFVSVWSRLRAIARRIPPPQGDEGRALRVLVFLSAGDALAAIDATAPSAGVEFSADGLRRLAKTLDPAFAMIAQRYNYVQMNAQESRLLECATDDVERAISRGRSVDVAAVSVVDELVVGAASLAGWAGTVACVLGFGFCC